MMQQFAPHPLLAPFIECIWRTTRDFQPPRDSFEILPDGYIELIWSSGAPCFKSIGAELLPLPRTYIVGILEAPWTLHAQGVVQTLGIRFWAWGFASLFGVPTLNAAALDRLLQTWSNTVIPLLAEPTDAVIRYLEAQLLTYIPQHQAPIHNAALQLSNDPARSIEAVAAAAFVSRRQLERQFNAALGVAPKVFARMLRFQQARDQLCAAPASDLATLAADCGYTDQAHFSREFKALSGRTPRQFAQHMRATHTLVQVTRQVLAQE